MYIRKEIFGGILFYEKDDKRIQLISKPTYAALVSFFNSKNICFGDIVRVLQKQNFHISEEATARLNDFLTYMVEKIDKDGGLKIRVAKDAENLWNQKWDGTCFSSPISVYWTFTNACNLHCSHCAWTSGQPQEHELSLEECLRIIDRLNDMGVIEISFSGGEPLAKMEHFLSMAKYAKKLGFRLGFATNATLIDEKVIEEIDDIGFSFIHVSFEGLESLNKIRGSRRLDQVMSGTKKLTDAGFKVHFNVAVNKMNFKEIENIVQCAVQMKVRCVRFVRFIPIGRGKKNIEMFLLTPDMERELAVAIYELEQKYKDVCKITTNRLYRIIGRMEYEKHDPEGYHSQYQFLSQDWDCSAGRDRVCIMPEGDVAPCPLIGSLGLSAGNVRQNGILEIWNESKMFKEIRLGKRFLSQKCSICSKWEVCRGGCKAASYANFENLFAPDPLCFSIGDNNDS